jgi:hypothetical protein
MLIFPLGIGLPLGFSLGAGLLTRRGPGQMPVPDQVHNFTLAGGSKNASI